MNDLEDLVREELRARVDAAEAKRTDGGSSALLVALDQRIRRASIRRRWSGAAFGGLAVAAVTALVLGLTSLGPAPVKPSVVGPLSQVPLTDTAATPKGWVPIAFDDAQISVPADWRVAVQPCDRAAPGYVVIGTSSSLVARHPNCKRAPNMAAIQVLPPGKGHTRHRTGQINGIPVLGGLTAPRGYASFLAPTLHAIITVRGPLGNKVLGTLTRSPFSVVLEAAPRLPVPASWHRHDFGGIRFATPAQWRTIKSRVWYPCWAAINSAQAVELVHATRDVAFSCSDTFGGTRPRRGLVVGAGRYAASHRPPDYGCRSLHGLRACFAMPWPGRPLELVVDVPGRHKPTVVDIGLAGNGVEARTIFESIRPR
jgi:hypothetical protein